MAENEDIPVVARCGDTWFNPSTWVAEADESLWVQASLIYIASSRLLRVTW